jgi:hypothetical protein
MKRHSLIDQGRSVFITGRMPVPRTLDKLKEGIRQRAAERRVS